MRLQMTRKKIVFTTIMLAVTFVVTMAAGIAMVMNSGAYVVAQSGIAQHLKLSSEPLTLSFHIAWWHPWSYSENASSGSATFTICAKNNLDATKCYSVRVKKEYEQWKTIYVQEST